MILYVATSNPGKLRDFAYAAEGYLLDGQTVGIEPLPGLAAIAAPAEDEATFEGNARLKALFYTRYAPGRLVLADDSGLEVDALDGAPGVRSARFADDAGYDLHSGATQDSRNNALVLDRLARTSAWAARGARYRCVLALARGSEDGRAEVVATAEGSVEGSILSAPRGSLGFGYDPIFLLPELDRTMAELEPATRLSLSHRGRALRTLLERLSGLDLT